MTKNVIALAGFFLACGLYSSVIPAQEQPRGAGLFVGDGSGEPNDTATSDLGYLQQNDIAQFTVDIFYDESIITPVLDDPGAANPTVTDCVSTPGGNWSNDATACNRPNPGQIRLTVASGFAADEPLEFQDPFGSITWNIAPDAAPGTVESLSVEVDVVQADGEPIPDDSLTISEGEITIFIDGPGYGSTPTAGDTIDLGSAVVGQTTAATTLTVNSVGTEDLVLGTNTIDAQFDITPDTDGVTLAPEASQDFDLTCTPDARGDITGSLSIANNSENIDPAEYDLECAGLAPNVAVDPASASVSVLALPGGDSDSATYTISNDDDGFTSDAENVTVAIDPVVRGGTPTVSVDPASFGSIAPDGSEDFDATCEADDGVAEGTYDFEITVEWDDPVSGETDSTTADFECEVIEALPVYESDPAVGSTLDFGTVTNGVTSDVMGIDVGNSDGQGPAPESDLNILSATADNAVFDVTVVNDGPFAAGEGPDGTDDIEVTCTPDAVDTFTGTLTVESDDPANPEATYDLACEGLSDGDFDSTPEAGGVLDLGFAEPGAQTAPGDIDFLNNGDANDITVSCTLDDPSGSFSQTPDPIDFTVGPGGTETATFQCIPETSDTFTATLTCDIGGDEDVESADYTILCQGQPLVVPTMGTWGLILLSLMLLVFGGLAGRRMLATRA